MWVVFYLFAIIGVLFALQTVVLVAAREPLQWTFGASSDQPKALRLALKVVLQATLLSSIFVFPGLVHTSVGRFYAPLFPWRQFPLFFYGEGLALILLGSIFGVETLLGQLQWAPRFTRKMAVEKSLKSALSSITVVCIEEPIFRGIILGTLLAAGTHWALAIPLSAALFSAAHFIRRVKTYWPAVGLAVLGLWLGVAFYKTGNLWLSMGLHSGGILAIGIHRCFSQYKGSPLLIGTQTFPIAGLISIAIMLIGSAVTWFLF